MASTYTTNLRLTKQGDGDNPNSWGQVLNDGVISLADQAIAGYTEVSIGSAATVNLTANDGADDQSRNAFLKITGSIGTAATSIFLVIPNKSKSYSVLNAVSANNASDVVMMRVAGNTGVTIGRSTTTFQHVVCDGASVRSVTVSGAQVNKSTTRFEGAVTLASGAPVHQAITTLTDAASIVMNMATNNQFVVTLGGNRTLAAPTNLTVGQTGHIYCIQDSTGSRTLGYNSVFQFAGGSDPVLTASGGSVDLLVFSVRATDKVDGVMVNDLK
jgi:hypothetical protein